MSGIVILSEAKNLIVSSSYAFEILRLTPQNDVVGQPLWGDFTLIKRFLSPGGGGFPRPPRLSARDGGQAAAIKLPPLLFLFDFKVDQPAAQSDASAFSDFDGNVAPLFEPLEKLGGLLRTGDGLVINT